MDALAETIGGGAGGWLGAALPDWIDPATSPNHRHVGHGVANAIGAVWLSAETILWIQRRLRERADRLKFERAYVQNDLIKFLYWLEEIALRFLAGFFHGLNAGYLSHLFLDALTARGIPIFARGY
jgi:biotin transporter BioY